MYVLYVPHCIIYLCGQGLAIFHLYDIHSFWILNLFFAIILVIFFKLWIYIFSDFRVRILFKHILKQELTREKKQNKASIPDKRGELGNIRNEKLCG